MGWGGGGGNRGSGSSDADTVPFLLIGGMGLQYSNSLEDRPNSNRMFSVSIVFRLTIKRNRGVVGSRIVPTDYCPNGSSKRSRGREEGAGALPPRAKPVKHKGLNG